MSIEVVKTKHNEIEAFRVMFLHEGNFQFTYDKCHAYGWADTYTLLLDGEKIGYGSVWGKDKREDRDSIFEFYLIPPFRKLANTFFPEFVAVSGAAYIECQSNDRLLTCMLYEYTTHINAEAILFKDHTTTNFTVPSATLERNVNESHERNRQYLMKVDGTLVANGGMIMNYNIPYVDLYYDVLEPHRRKGYGTFLVQELKKEAYRINRVPAARCGVSNLASKSTLLKSGFAICGHRLCGLIQKSEKK